MTDAVNRGTILAEVPGALANGVALKRWWDGRVAARKIRRVFPVVGASGPGERSFGFSDEARLPMGRVPVSGVADEWIFDRAKGAALGRLATEFREFVLRYFLRVSDYDEPAVGPGTSAAGFGFSQHYCKRRGAARAEEVPPGERFRIVDLRNLAGIFEWLVLKVRLYDFNVGLSLPRAGGARLEIPLNEETYLAASDAFLVDQDRPAPGVLGRYGFGYAFLRNPGPSVLAFGPGQFQVAIKQMVFEVLDNGAIRARTLFISNRPEQVLNLSGLGSRGPLAIDPVSASISAARAFAPGLADRWGVSMESLERAFLQQHCRQHYRMFTGALMTWRRQANWLDQRSLPAWATQGTARLLR